MLSNSPISVVLPAVDIERAKKFYTEQLGLREAAAQEPGGITFECGNGTYIYIYERPAVKIEHTQASFMVEDLESEMSILRSKGVVFEEYDFPGLKTINGVAEIDGFKAAWFKDTEGNILSLGQAAK